MHEDEAHAKQAWLHQKRLEHERNLRRRSSTPGDGPGRADEPDDAAVKRDWLRRRRQEHEVAMGRRAGASNDDARLVDASLAPSDRELYLRQLADQRSQAQRERRRNSAAESSVDAPPLVDASLLSTPSERELFLRQLAEQRSQSERDRRRMSSDAARRPSFSAKDADESLAEMYGHNYAECGGDTATSSAANSTTADSAEREAEEMAELEALEAMRFLSVEGGGPGAI